MPVPPGYKLDQPQSNLPPGYTLDAPQASPATPSAPAAPISANAPAPLRYDAPGSLAKYGFPEGGFADKYVRPLGNAVRTAGQDITSIPSTLKAAATADPQPLSAGDLAGSAIVGPAYAPLKSAIQGIRDSYKQGGVEKALTDTAGHVISTIGSGEALRAFAPLAGNAGSMLRSTGASVNNAVIGTTADSMEYGGNAGRALSTNRIIGPNANKLMSGVKKALPDAANEHRAIVASNPRGELLNTGPMVSSPFDSLISDSTNPRTGVAAPSQVNRASLTRRLLTNVPDDVSGKPTPMMRDPYLTPLEAIDLKSNIYNMTDYDNPSQSALSNQGLKGAAYNLKTGVAQAVPESVEAGQRLHDLMSAKDLLMPQSKFVKIPTSKAGVIDQAVTLGGTATGAGLDVLGYGAQKLGKYLNSPSLAGAYSNLYNTQANGKR